MRVEVGAQAPQPRAMTPAAAHVVMGRVGAPWGIKGWLKLYSYADPPANLLEYLSFWVRGASGLQSLESDEIKVHGQDFVGHIKGCDVREQAGRYTGLDLMLEKSALPELVAGFYWHQLEGLRVLTQSGHDLGIVQYLMETGANDVLVVKGDERSVDRKERLLPYLTDKIVKRVDLATGLVLVDWEADWEADTVAEKDKDS